MSTATSHTAPQASPAPQQHDMSAVVMELMQELRAEREARKEEQELHRKQMEEHNRLMRKVLTHIETTVKPWLSVDEACQMLGIRHTKSGKHRNHMANAARRFGIRSQGQKPPVYHREDIEALAKKVANGEAYIR